jgi:predicted DNA-binding transcriptional regulator AlpA
MERGWSRYTQEDKMIETNKSDYDVLIRLSTVLTMLPISKSSWFNGIRDGRFPRPVKLGPRTSAWREQDILELIEHGAQQKEANGPACHEM